MKRFVSGIIILVLGLFAVLGAASPRQPASAMGPGLTFLAGGAILTYYGWRKLGRRRQVAGEAIVLLQDRGNIPGDILASRTGLSEYQARLLLGELKNKGTVPFQAEVV